MTEREPESVDFAPQRLTGGRRRVDPLAIGALVVVAGLGAAVLKPWGGEPAPVAEASRDPAASSAVVIPATDPPSDPDGAAEAVPAPPVGLAEPLLGWATAEAALQPRPAWGIRTLIADPEPDPAAVSGEPTVVERWTQMVVDASPAMDLELGSADRRILALGLTHPSDDAPLDARVWRAVDDGWEWLAAEPLGPTDDGTFLFSPPRVGETYLAAWPAGRYLVEWLGPNGVDAVSFRIGGRFDGAEPSLAPLKPPDRTLPSPLRPDFRLEPDHRLFAVTRGVAEGLAAPGTVPLDAARAWRQALPRPLAGSALAGEVATAFLPEANGLGVLLPVDAQGANGSIVSLGPETQQLAAQRVVGIRFLEAARAPYVIFRAPDGGSWLPGVYRLDVSWTGDEGPRRTSYHLEVRPAP